MVADDDIEKNFARRDRLLKIESDVQQLWTKHDVFRAEPGESPPKPGDKFFGNFPFPYMNGYLHLGHAFSLSKLEFAAAFHRLTGANVLLPFAFHCTGMPIKAAADKLLWEKHEFGTKIGKEYPVFPDDVKDEEEPTSTQPTEGDAKAKSKGKKSKTVAKTGLEEPSTQAPGAKFKGKKSKTVAKTGLAKPQWEIMRSYGLADEEIEKFIDPYHWLAFFPPLAIEDLKKFGLGCDWRRTFITTDMNPFFDSFVRWQMRKLKSIGKIVKDLRYAIYSPKDCQPCADHDRASGEGVIPKEYTLMKMEVVAPFPPKMSVLEGKNVYLAGATLRPEYGQTNAWVQPDGKYGAFEINETDVFILTKRAARNLAFQRLSREPGKEKCLVELTGQDIIGLPLRSPLAVNEVIYTLPMLSFLTEKGTGIVTSDDRREVQEEAKSSIRNLLLERNQAVVYSEPEKKVMSRSGDECVVALTDQWYITYGESDWRKLAEECFGKMNLFFDETRNGFERTLSWLNQWACSRNFGLGTRIPWDDQFLVESLSDSTIYMAYYTVCHLIQGGSMYGKDAAVIKPEQLTDEVWDFIFLDGPFPESSGIPSALLNEMKTEFEYWYPFDLRVSGKDLTQNHLTFCVYNHTAIFPEKHWPQGFRCNGHLTLNSKKMSKSTGNFRTLREAIQEFSADATRFSLADAGDGTDDANFVFETANNAIKRLTKELDWVKEVVESKPCLSSVPTSSCYADEVFANEMNYAVKMAEKCYREYRFRDALKIGFYDLQSARDYYKKLGGMKRDMLLRFIDVQTRLIAPICPHYAEHVWREILKKDGFVIKAGWPEADVPDLKLKRSFKYLQDTISSARKLLKNQQNSSSTVKLNCGVIFVHEYYDGWKEECLLILKETYNSATGTFAADDERISELQTGLKEGEVEAFVKFIKGEVKAFGVHAFDIIGEFEVLETNSDFIRRQLGLKNLEIFRRHDERARELACKYEDLLKKNPPSPGKPTSIFLAQ